MVTTYQNSNHCLWGTGAFALQKIGSEGGSTGSVKFGECRVFGFLSMDGWWVILGSKELWTAFSNLTESRQTVMQLVLAFSWLQFESGNTPPLAVPNVIQPLNTHFLNNQGRYVTEQYEGHKGRTNLIKGVTVVYFFIHDSVKTKSKI